MAVGHVEDDEGGLPARPLGEAGQRRADWRLFDAPTYEGMHVEIDVDDLWPGWLRRDLNRAVWIGRTTRDSAGTRGDGDRTEGGPCGGEPATRSRMHAFGARAGPQHPPKKHQ